MKILTRKQQNEFLKRIADCQIICNNYLEVMEALDKITENLADMAILVDGCAGADKVLKTMHSYEKGKKK